MAVLAGTQLDFFSIGASEGLAVIENQEPLHPWLVFVSSDNDIDKGYKCLERVFQDKYVVLDLETYGETLPDVALSKKHSTRSYKKGETNALQNMALSAYYGNIRLMQLQGMTQDEVLVIDFKTKWDKPNLSPQYIEFISSVIEKIHEFAKRKGVFIGHNIGFDLLFMRNHYGVKCWAAYDTMIMSQLLTAGILTYRHSLADCVKRNLGIDNVDKSEQKSDFSLPLRNRQINYGGMDIVYTRKLFQNLAAKIKEAGLQMAAKIEAEFTPALVEINHWGLPVDLVELERQIKWYYAKLMNIEMEFLAMYPGGNIRSSQQIAGIVTLLNKLIEESKKQADDDSDDDIDESASEQETVIVTLLNKLIDASQAQADAARNDGMDESIIEHAIASDIVAVIQTKYGSSKSDLALLGDHRVVQLVTDYRTVLIYLNYCKQVKQELICVEGIWRVSGSVRQLTRKGQGRTCSGSKRNPLKCQGVNLQNPPNAGKMPKRLKSQGCPIVRDIFKPPTKDWKFINQDLPAAHLAIATFLAGETATEEAARNNLDLHAITMFSVFQTVDEYKIYRHMTVEEISKVNKDETHSLNAVFKPIRASCKNIIYGGLNNQSAPTLQNTIKTGQNKEVPIEICEAMVNAFKDIFPKIANEREVIWKASTRNQKCIDGNSYGIISTDYCTNKVEGFSRYAYSFCKKAMDGRPYVGRGEIALIWLIYESEIMKSGIASIYQKTAFAGQYDLRLSLICHDEILAYVPENQSKECAEIVKQSMLFAMNRFTGEGKVAYPEMEKPSEKLIMDGWDH